MANRTNLITGLLIDVAIPIGILTYLSSSHKLGPLPAFLIALAFPTVHGIIELIRCGQFNHFAALGLCSVLTSSIIFLMHLEPSWVAIKEALVPAIVGIVLLIAELTSLRLASGLFLKTINVQAVKHALRQKHSDNMLNKLSRGAGLMLIGAMFIASLLNYILAKSIVSSSPGSEAFNHELARMSALSIIVIVLPASIIILGTEFVFLLLIRKNTELPWETILGRKRNL